MARPASTTVALPRWVVALLVTACAVCLVAVAFLLGRVTAPAPPVAASGAEVATGPAPTVARASAPDGRPAPAGSPEASPDALPSRIAEPAEAGGRGLAPASSAGAGSAAGGHPDAAAVAAYFTRMDAVAAQVKATQDPEALARTILDQTLSGNMSGFEELITTQRALQARMAEVLPPAPCREHHQRSLRLIGRAIALLERTRDAVASKNPSDLASMATEGHAIEEEARATDALANDLRRAAGLPAVP
jgi:hypothetical protein